MQVSGIIETALYVADIKRSAEFKSIYFRDPDSDLAELITAGFWAIH